jgi:hypothetical protein
MFEGTSNPIKPNARVKYNIAVLSGAAAKLGG